LSNVNHHKYKGGAVDYQLNKVNMATVMRTVSEYVNDKTLAPIYQYSELPSIPYVKSLGINRLGCHAGQRKLLMTEIEFMSTCTNDVGLIIYAGSAPCEKLPILIKMFPDKKFLLIDPNYHGFDFDFTYVYQNVESISSQNKSSITRYYGKIASVKKRLTHARFYKTAKTYDLLTPNKAKMKLIHDNFLSTNHKTLVSDIMSGTDKVFIIQDYISTGLAELLTSTTIDICFISDIRTNMFKNAPTDLDLIWNDALILMVVQILKPVYSMIKFHPPYTWNDNTVEEYIANPNASKYDSVRGDLQMAASKHGFDTVKNYTNKKYMYLKNSDIYLQTWAPPASSEARLIIPRGNNNRLEHYDSGEWDNKFSYLKLTRGYGFYGAFYNEIKNRNDHTYDGCFDCMLDILILANYVVRSTKTSINIPDIIEKFKLVPFQNEVLKLNDLVTNLIMSSATKKCIFHGQLTVPPDGLRFYTVSSHNHCETSVMEMHRLVDSKIISTDVATYDCKLKKADVKALSIADNISVTSNKANIEKIERYIKRKC
jgi:hypothetical protein